MNNNNIGAQRQTGNIRWRIWRRVDTRGNDDCWEWLGAKNQSGYGVITKAKSGGGSTATRVFWETYYGELHKDIHVGHTCANRGCMNPMHLYTTTRSENIKESVARRGGKKYAFPHKRLEVIASIQEDARRWRAASLDNKIPTFKPYEIQNQETMVCGHSTDMIRSSEEGTSFCIECEHSEMKAKLISLKQMLEG